jgi:hypothetical protein
MLGRCKTICQKNEVRAERDLLEALLEIVDDSAIFPSSGGIVFQWTTQEANVHLACAGDAVIVAVRPQRLCEVVSVEDTKTEEIVNLSVCEEMAEKMAVKILFFAKAWSSSVASQALIEKQTSVPTPLPATSACVSDAAGIGDMTTSPDAAHQPQPSATSPVCESTDVAFVDKSSPVAAFQRLDAVPVGVSASEAILQRPETTRKRIDLDKDDVAVSVNSKDSGNALTERRTIDCMIDWLGIMGELSDRNDLNLLLAGFCACASFDDFLRDRLSSVKTAVNNLKEIVGCWPIPDSHGIPVTYGESATIAQRAPGIKKRLDQMSTELTKLRALLKEKTTQVDPTSAIVTSVALSSDATLRASPRSSYIVTSVAKNALQRWFLEKEFEIRSLDGDMEELSACANFSRSHLEGAIGYLALIAVYTSTVAYAVTSSTGLYGMNVGDENLEGTSNAFKGIGWASFGAIMLLLVMIGWWLKCYAFLLLRCARGQPRSAPRKQSFRKSSCDCCNIRHKLA